MNEDTNTKPVFTDNVTRVTAQFANTLAYLAYDVFQKATNVEQARNALGLQSMALQKQTSVAISGGSINGTVIGAANPKAGRFTDVTIVNAPTADGHAVPKGYLDTRLGNLPDVIAGLGVYAKQDSPELLGTPTTTTPDGTVIEQITNVEFVNNAISTVVASAPTGLNTLKKISDALGGKTTFSKDVFDALSFRLRVDVAEQNLNTQQKQNACTNLGLAKVATTGSYNDLSDRPAGLTRNYNDLQNLPQFATVAFTGDYASLINKPSLVTLGDFNTYQRSQVVRGVTLNAVQGPIKLDLTLSGFFRINAAGNVTLINPTLIGLDGYHFRVQFKQDAGGGRSLVLDSMFVFGIGESFSVSPAPNSITVIDCTVDAANNQIACTYKQYQAPA